MWSRCFSRLLLLAVVSIEFRFSTSTTYDYVFILFQVMQIIAAINETINPSISPHISMFGMGDQFF